MPESLDISIVIPAYNEEESLPALCRWIFEVLGAENRRFEVLFIDDGSADSTWSVIQELAAQHPQVKGYRLSRNFGKSAALDLGFKVSQGAVVITMDADLQDSPEEIPALHRMITEEGYDLVSGWKQKRFDPIGKTIPSKFFNWVTRKLSGIPLHDFNCGLKAYRSKVVKNIHLYGEMHRYIPLIAKWAGFTHIGEKVVSHQARRFGVSKFGLERFLHGFLDLISVSFVNRYKKKPMHFFGALGTVSFLSGFTITLYLIFQKIIGLYKGLKVREIVDQPLFFLALVALIVGVQLFLTGFMAEMVVSQNATKQEYTVDEKVNA
ncbi:MAG: glycosyltransferase family 2 protein [Nitritalea sp.]